MYLALALLHPGGALQHPTLGGAYTSAPHWRHVQLKSAARCLSSGAQPWYANCGVWQSN
jgi:hypothetical protein